MKNGFRRFVIVLLAICMLFQQAAMPLTADTAGTVTVFADSGRSFADSNEEKDVHPSAHSVSPSAAGRQSRAVSSSSFRGSDGSAGDTPQKRDTSEKHTKPEQGGAAKQDEDTPEDTDDEEDLRDTTDKEDTSGESEKNDTEEQEGEQSSFSEGTSDTDKAPGTGEAQEIGKGDNTEATQEEGSTGIDSEATDNSGKISADGRENGQEGNMDHSGNPDESGVTGDQQNTDVKEEDPAAKQEDGAGTAEDGVRPSEEGDKPHSKQAVNSLLPAQNVLRVAARANNSINMPTPTYQTFILQGKNGQGQKIGNSGRVTMLSSRQAIQDDITANHYDYVSFTPHWGSGTSASLSTQDGSKSASFYVSDPNKAEHVGGIGEATMTPNIIGGRVFRLEASMKNNLSCTYYNVGRYYDRSSGRSYAIDMRAVMVDFTKKPKATADVQNAIAAGALDDEGGPLFCFVGVQSIGVLAAFCDAVTVRYEYYIHGTQTPVSLKGFARFGDVDAQQGIEFSPQADYFYATNAANDYLGFSKGVYTPGNTAYIYSLSSAAHQANEGNTFYTLFSGSQLTLRYTFAKCSRKDDGGKRNNNNLTDYKVPFDNSDVKHYSSSASRGYMHFSARQPYLAKPEISKSVFNGSNIAAEVQTPHTATSNQLSAVTDVFTYKIRAVCPYEDASQHHYPSWIVQDQISPYLKVDQAVVYDGTGALSQDFRIQSQVQGDGSTIVTAQAIDPAAQSFYEKNWYDLYITVRVKSRAELKTHNLNFSSQYVSSGNHAGKYVLRNHAVLSVGTTYTSNTVETVLPQLIKVKKVNKYGSPVQGITFGIFNSAGADAGKDRALMTAVTGSDGVAVFRASSFFNLAGKTGPYYIKEISRGDLENVYVLDKDWNYAFSADMGNTVVFGDNENPEISTLDDESKIVRKHSVIVRKKNRETSDFLRGAVFALYQWSQTGGSYMKLEELEEAEDESGQIFYRNTKDFESTEDNMGRFMIREEKAPFGCYNAGKSWTFSTTDAYSENADAIAFLYTSDNGRKQTQTGQLIYENHLQKGILTIHKTDETGASVKGALFSVKAAEDIYAPWQCDENGNPYPGQEPLAAAGTVCCMLTTDKEGKAVSDPLYIGSYQVIEIGGAPDHVLSDQVYEVHFAYPEEDDVKTVEETVEAGNVTMKPAFAVSKIADRTRNPEGEQVAFDKKTGRYIEEKIPGVYRAGETIRYRITVTNTGNTELRSIRLHDSMGEANENGQKLEEYVDLHSAAFALSSTGRLESTKGDVIQASLSADNRQSLLLDHLEAGDSVDVVFEVKVLDTSANVYDLINKISVTASYDNNEERPGQHLIPVNTEDLIDEEGNPLTEDEDSIHIPGEPGTEVVKLADRTTGAVVTDGVLNGTKVPGLYYEGDTVRFSIHVKNTGTANLKNILVTDVMSEELKKVVDVETASFCLDTVVDDQKAASQITDDQSADSQGVDGHDTGSQDMNAQETNGQGNVEDQGVSGRQNRRIRTNSGESVSVRQIDNTRVILCEDVDPFSGEGMLQPGDTVTLFFEAKVKKDAANLYDLANLVVVNAMYFTGEEDASVPEKQDEDRIELPGVPEAKVAKIADRTTGAVLKEGRYQNEKITGSYENGSKIVFTIKVTNSGSADLYDLKVRDVMEERLMSALESDTVLFQEGNYTTSQGDSVKTERTSPLHLILDHLNAGDSVDLKLHATVAKQAGDLFRLENKVYVTGHYRKGNETCLQEYEEESSVSGHTYVMEYHANNGTSEKTSDSETPAHKGEEIHINGNPFTKEGYEFLGWNTKADGTGKDYAPGALYTMPEKDVHLYARWGSRGSILKKTYTYSLTYHSNNPLSQSWQDSETRCASGTAVLLDENAFSYEGYRFTGWALTPDGESELLQPGLTFRMPDKDTHLYARWEKLDKASLVYHNNISGQEQKVTDFQTPCVSGTEVSVKQSVFEREDYAFTGWSRSAEGQKPEYQPGDVLTLEENMDLYAVWKKKKDGKDELQYRLIYHGNNETDAAYSDSETPCPGGREILLDQNPFHYEGYSFAGWNTKADGTGQSWKVQDSFKMPERHVHLYALWNKDSSCTLTYVSNPPMEEQEKTEIVDCETPCTEQTMVHLDGCAFQYDGYAFLGWSLSPDGNGELLQPGVQFTVSQDTKLYAVWTDQIEEYTLLYSSNMETSIWEAAPSSPAPAGTPHTILNNPFASADNIFVGWSTDADVSPDASSLLRPGEYFEQPAENTVLYAIWKKGDSHTLYYDANGGTAVSSAEKESGRISDEETPGTAGSVIRLNPSPFEREGYRFVGWSSEKLGSVRTEAGDTADGTDGLSMDQAAERAEIWYPGCAYVVPDTDVVLYALWEKVPTTDFSEENPSSDEEALADSPYTPIPVTELMKDQDHINIPGEPELRIAKKADKTKGIRLEQGRYQGRRKPGVYKKDDRVIYTITISNLGTATVSDIVIQDMPSKKWQQSMASEGFTAAVGESLQTTKGNLVQVLDKTEDTLTLDQMLPGDSLAVTCEAKVTADEVKTVSLKNTVEVTGKRHDGSALAETKYMKDSDTISLKGDKKVQDEKQGGQSGSGSPETGDQNPLLFWMFTGAGAAAFAGAILAGKIRKKQKK